MPDIQVMNPYTFIPFGKEPTRTPVAETYSKPEELLSGWLDIDLVTKRQVAIPDGAKAQGKEGEHQTYPFFRLPDGTPAIPGSEIRGMLRSVYEAASNSCVPFLLDDNQKSMRVPLYAALKNRGLLKYENEKWSLWSAWDREKPVHSSEVEYGEYHGHHCGDCIISTTKEWIQFSKPVSDGKYNIHYLQPNEQLYIWEKNEPYDILKNELEKLGNPSHEGLLNNLRKVKKAGSGYVPVWYQAVRNDATKQYEYYISPSSIGRINQVKHWKDIMGSYAPCSDMDQVCPACSLFGNVSVFGKGIQIKGRLRFSDALPKDGHLENDTKKGVLLPILSIPKPSAYEFYIHRPKNAKFWNYDLYSTTEGLGMQSRPVYHRNDDFAPAGRKFYWHSVEQTGNEESNQNATVEVVKADECFNFRLYFDRITELQLKELCWVVTLGDNSRNSRLQHKIGHARPVGYGSVKLVITSQVLRKVEKKDGQWCYTLDQTAGSDAYLCPFAPSEALKALLVVCDAASTTGEYVSYPVRTDDENGQTIYKWFADGRNIGGGEEIQTLPATIERRGVDSEEPKGVRKNDGSSTQKPAVLTPQFESSDIGSVIQVKITKIIKDRTSCIGVGLNNQKEYTVLLKKKYVQIGQKIPVNVTGVGEAERIG